MVDARSYPVDKCRAMIFELYEELTQNQDLRDAKIDVGCIDNKEDCISISIPLPGVDTWPDTLCLKVGIRPDFAGVWNIVVAPGIEYYRRADGFIRSILETVGVDLTEHCCECGIEIETGNDVLVCLGRCYCIPCFDEMDPHRSDGLDAACLRGDAVAVEHLLVVGNVLPNNNHLDRASKRGKVKIVDLLLDDNRIDPAVNQQRALHLACLNNCIAVVVRLLADPRVKLQRYHHEIKIAAKYNYVEILAILLEHPNANFIENAIHGGDVALVHAAHHGHFKAVQMLLKDERIHADAMNNYPIFKSIALGHHAITNMLLSYPSVRIGLNPLRDGYPTPDDA